MKINAIFTRKEPELNPKECIIEHIEFLTDSAFEHFRKNLLFDYSFIERNIDNMYHDDNGTLHAIAAVNEETGDGILIDSSGSTYARYSSYVPKILPYIDEVITELANDLVIDFAFDNEIELELSKISSLYQIALRKGNGIAEMFQEKASSLDAFESFEITESWIRAEVNQELDEEYVLRLGEM